MSAPTPEERIGLWEVPTLGTVAVLPAHLLPSNALRDSANIIVREAVLQARPGLVRDPRSVDGAEWGTPTGATWIAGPGGVDYLVVGTSTHLLAQTGPGHHRVLTRPLTGIFEGVLHGNLDHPAQFASIELDNVPSLVHTNGVDAPLLWEVGSEFAVLLEGDPVGPEGDPGPPVAPPRWTDVTNIGDHFIGIIPPFTVRWGRNRDLRHWDALNVKSMSETGDRLVAIDALGTLGGAIYKQRTLWGVFAQGGDSEASFYRFEYRGAYEGPAGANALVNVDGAHVYMTNTGRIGWFNGSQHQWIAEGLWPQTRARLSPRFARRTVGVYNPMFHELSFYYVRLEDTDGLPRGLVLLTLPRPGVRSVLGAFGGHLAPNAQVGGSPLAITAGATTSFPRESTRVLLSPAQDAGLLLDATGDHDREPVDEGLAVGEGQDLGEPFDLFWEPGLQATPSQAETRITSVEPALETHPLHGALTVAPVRSYALGGASGEVGAPIPVDLTHPEVRPITGFDSRGRFHGLRFAFTPTASRANGGARAPRIRFHGAFSYGHRL